MRMLKLRCEDQTKSSLTNHSRKNAEIVSCWTTNPGVDITYQKPTKQICKKKRIGNATPNASRSERLQQCFLSSSLSLLLFTTTSFSDQIDKLATCGYLRQCSLHAREMQAANKFERQKFPTFLRMKGRWTHFFAAMTPLVLPTEACAHRYSKCGNSSVSATRFRLYQWQCDLVASFCFAQKGPLLNSFTSHVNVQNKDNTPTITCQATVCEQRKESGNLLRKSVQVHLTDNVAEKNTLWFKYRRVFTGDHNSLTETQDSPAYSTTDSLRYSGDQSVITGVKLFTTHGWQKSHSETHC